MLALMTWPQWLLAVTLIGVCLFLMLVILLQRGRGGGVAGAFGGGGGSGAFGAKTGDVFTWITVVVATVFVGLAVAANFAFDESRVAAGDKAALEIPAGAPGEDGEALPVKTFPVRIGEDGKAVPIEIESTQIIPAAGQGAGDEKPQNAAPANAVPTNDATKPTGSGDGSTAAPDSKPTEGAPPTASDSAPDKPGKDSTTP